MKIILVSAFSLTTILASLPAQATQTLSIDKSAHTASVAKISELPDVLFVHGSRNSGYYLISPDSNAIDTMGLQHAPYVDSDRNGVGLDSIAFRFGPDGKLEGFPMYISQLSPDSFHTERLVGFSSRYSTIKLVHELFEDHTIHIEKEGARSMAFVEVPIYNPLTSGS